MDRSRNGRRAERHGAEPIPGAGDPAAAQSRKRASDMNKLANVLRIAVFLISTLISAGLFGGLAVWAVLRLDPATQEVIGLVNSPWVTASTHSKKKTESMNAISREGDSAHAAASLPRRP
jgi:hypothetical protein